MRWQGRWTYFGLLPLHHNCLLKTCWRCIAICHIPSPAAKLDLCMNTSGKVKETTINYLKAFYYCFTYGFWFTDYLIWWFNYQNTRNNGMAMLSLWSCQHGNGSQGKASTQLDQTKFLNQNLSRKFGTNAIQTPLIIVNQMIPIGTILTYSCPSQCQNWQIWTQCKCYGECYYSSKNVSHWGKINGFPMEISQIICTTESQTLA